MRFLSLDNITLTGIRIVSSIVLDNLEIHYIPLLNINLKIGND